MVGLSAGHEAKAKKKKKKKTCKRGTTKCGKKCCPKGQKCLAGTCAVPCTFVTAGSVMTLQANCTTTSTIAIPDGVTLDGDGKTIILAGPANRFSAGVAGIRTVGETANLSDVTIDGSGLTGACGPIFDVSGAVLFEASGEIENVTVRNSRCINGLVVINNSGPPSPRTVDVSGVTVSNAPVGDAILFLGGLADRPLTANLADATIEGATRGVRVELNVNLSVDNARIAASDIGLLAEQGGKATVADSSVTGATFGLGAADATVSIGPSTLTATGNTVVGRGQVAGSTYGIAYASGAAGSTSGNTVSNFFDSVGSEGCGIFVAADAGAVTIGANTFPDPPGNEQNVCDFRA